MMAIVALLLKTVRRFACSHAFLCGDDGPPYNSKELNNGIRGNDDYPGNPESAHEVDSEIAVKLHNGVALRDRTGKMKNKEGEGRPKGKSKKERHEQ
jgi:hypothetical protein